MATRPTRLPEWASSGINVLEPAAGKKAAGWLANEVPPAPFFNWLFSTIYQWLAWMGGVREAIELNALINTLRYSTSGGTAMNAFAVTDTGVVLAVGAGGKAAVTQSHGSSWTQPSVGSSYTGDFNDVVWTGTAWIAVGAAGEIQRNTTHNAFTRVTPAATANTLSGIARTATGTIIAIGASGTAVKSVNDGLAWTSLTAINGGNYNSYGAGACLLESNGVFVACGNPGSTNRATNLQRSTGGDFAAVDLTNVLPAGYYVAELVPRPGGGFHARATDGTNHIVLQSDTGIAWAVVSTLSGPFSTDYRLCASSAIVILVPVTVTNPNVFVSVDGGGTWRTQIIRTIMNLNRMQMLDVGNTRVFVHGGQGVSHQGFIGFSQLWTAPI